MTIKQLINMDCPVCNKKLGVIKTVVLGFAERQHKCPRCQNYVGIKKNYSLIKTILFSILFIPIYNISYMLTDYTYTITGSTESYVAISSRRTIITFLLASILYFIANVIINAKIPWHDKDAVLLTDEQLEENAEKRKVIYLRIGYVAVPILIFIFIWRFFGSRF